MTRPTSPAVNFDSVPDDLRCLNRWCLWRYVQKERKDGTKVWTKLPITRAGKPASSTDASTWCSFDEIRDAYLFGTTRNDGVGVTFDGSDQLVGVDLDDCIDVLGNFSPLAQQVLDRVPGYADVSPSGTGIKLWTRAVVDSHKTAKGAPDAVEIYPHGRYFTVTGQQVTASGVDDWTLRDCAIPSDPIDLSWLVAQVFGPGAVRQRSTPVAGAAQSTGDDADADALALYRRPLDGWPLERVQEELLPVLDPGCSYDEWLQIGAALHHQGEGDEEWLELWDTWSAGSAEKWAEGYCQEKWESFHTQRVSGRGPVTLATVLKLVADAKGALHEAVLSEWAAKILAAENGVELETKVCPAISKDVRLSDNGREVLVQNFLKQRFKALTHALPVANIRKLVAPAPAKGTNVAPAARGLPDWAQRWVYLTLDSVFLHLDTKDTMTSASFDKKFAHILYDPSDNSGPRPSDFATAVLDIPVVTGLMYAPFEPEMFEYRGLTYVNSYRPDLLPQETHGWKDPEDVMAAYLCEQHLFKLFGGDRSKAFILLDWMAWCVQNPGRKIGWSPLIKGAPGVGKSTLARILSAAMGEMNVQEVSAKTVTKDFTSWAAGACVRVIDELMVYSKSRGELAETLKTYIANDTVTVVRKGKDEVTVMNTQNYLAFTNHNDAISLGRDDRRWWVAFAACQTLEEVRQEFPPIYWDRLNSAIRERPGAVRTWLLEWRVRDCFDPRGLAPRSEEKELMAQADMSEDDDNVDSAIQAGGVGVAMDALSVDHLRGLIAASGVRLDGNRFVLGRALEKLGYFRYAVKVWFDGRPRRVWVRDPKRQMSTPENLDFIRKVLDPTLTSSESAV